MLASPEGMPLGPSSWLSICNGPSPLFLNQYLYNYIATPATSLIPDLFIGSEEHQW